MASSSASTSTFASPSTDFYYSYDVFINCHSSVKNTFSRHLYQRLVAYGLRVFLDLQELQEADNFYFRIERVIQTTSVHVAIFSPGYPESAQCFNELLLMLESRDPIIPVFYHVTPAQVRFNRGDDGVYAQALRKLEETKLRYESNTIENWRNALSAVAEISGFDLEAFDGDEGELLDRVVDGVLRKLKKPPLYVAEYPIGLAEKVNDFENKVLLQPGGKPSVAGIVGLGGVGKTTLAKELFNRTRSQYNRSCFLSDVRESSLTSLQKTLLKQLIGSDLKIDNIYEGKETLKKHLSGSNAFIILDDVDHLDQVEALLPDKAILCSDNFILITSRDKDVLTSSGVENGSIYRLTGLNEQHSRELFCLHAFIQPYPSPGFESMVDDFLEACGGLPLSLKVLGAHLCGQNDLHYWENQLDKLQHILPTDILATLQISYNSLNSEEQHIFLDIACFFIGEDRDKAIRIWDGCGWKGRLSFRNLQNKSLVEADSENYIRMHDHLRDLGRKLAKQEPRGRLWRPIDSLSDDDDVSQQSSVRGIYMVQRRSEQSIEDPVELGNRFINFTLSNRLVDMANRFISSIFSNRFVDMGNRSNNFTLDNSFLEMSGLQLLRAEGNCLESISHGLRHSNLVWLHWNICPYTSLPDWIPKKNLRVLEVNGGELETLWQTESEAPLQLRELNISSTLLRVPKSIGHLRHLEKMDLSWCRDLQTLPPSLGNLANLRYINLNGCFRLEDLPDSFGNLSRLQHLYLAGCSSLTISSITFGNIRKLEILDLSNCRRMEALPPQVTDQHSLKELNLKHTNLTELPIAIGNLRQLEILKLQCPFLEMLPSSLGKLTSLEELTLHFCNKLRHLPDSVGELTHLTTLTIHYAPIEYLPAAVMRLNNLEILKVRSCPLLEVPFNSVEKVGLLDSSIDKTCMIRLRHIDLQGTRLKELSFCKGVCPNLQRLNVSYCHELVLVGALPTTLISLDLQECPALKEIKGLSGLAQLRLLDISGCDKIEKLPGLDTLGSLEELRADGCNKVKYIGKIRMNMRRKSRDSSHSVSGKKIKL